MCQFNMSQKYIPYAINKSELCLSPLPYIFINISINMFTYIFLWIFLLCHFNLYFFDLFFICFQKLIFCTLLNFFLIFLYQITQWEPIASMFNIELINFPINAMRLYRELFFFSHADSERRKKLRYHVVSTRRQSWLHEYDERERKWDLEWVRAERKLC